MATLPVLFCPISNLIKADLFDLWGVDLIDLWDCVWSEPYECTSSFLIVLLTSLLYQVIKNYKSC
jgi:hypothetical protein